MNDISVFCIIFSCVVFLTNCIVEVIKQVAGVKGSRNINLIALITGVIIALLSYFVYISYTNTPIIWYGITGAILGGVLAALVAMLGWDKVIGIWKQSQITANDIKRGDK